MHNHCVKECFYEFTLGSIHGGSELRSQNRALKIETGMKSVPKMRREREDEGIRRVYCQTFGG